MPIFNNSTVDVSSNSVAICYGLLIVALVAAMLLQMLLELKNGMHHASISTKKLVRSQSFSLNSP